MAKKQNIRALGALITWQVIEQGQSLDRAFNKQTDQLELSSQDRGFLQELVYGVIRWYWPLNEIASQLLTSPIRKKDRVVHFLLLIGLYQLKYLETASHAGVSETVNGCIALKKQWAKNLINGCLRNFLRNPIQLKETISHPQWLEERIEQVWGDNSKAIFSANNTRPPMCLRINQRVITREAYLDKLNTLDIEATLDPYSQDGIRLVKPVPVTTLPDFFAGHASIQDTAAQLACRFLQVEAEHFVLDACAAPGGKTAHILEKTNNQCELTALDISEVRCEQLYDTLGRLNLDAKIYAADASKLDTWPQPKHGFDRILIDAPCSGLGVIRRHPDIKHHRLPSDIQQLLSIQQQLLVSLWPILKPGGRLLYMTCSILPDENQQQIIGFLENHKHDARVIDIKHPNALEVNPGVQTLPGIHDMDGFYYCLLEKHAE